MLTAWLASTSRDIFSCLAWPFRHQKGHFSTLISYLPFPPHFIYPVISTQGSLQYTLGHFLSDTENINLGLNKSQCFVLCWEKNSEKKKKLRNNVCVIWFNLSQYAGFSVSFTNILIIHFVFRKYTSQYNPTVFFCLFTVLFNNLNFRKEKVIHNDMKPTRTAQSTVFACFITFASVSISPASPHFVM